MLTIVLLLGAGYRSIMVSDPSDCPPVAIRELRVLRTIPNQKSGFTEGLIYFNGALYESTGNREGTGTFAKSVINQINPVDGSVRVVSETPGNAFGEGLAVLNEVFYQLTYKERKIFSYSFSQTRETLELEKQFQNPQKQGWGLTTNGEDLIASDGSASLYFLDPITLKTKKIITVQDANGKTYSLLNELEYVSGRIYANLFKSDLMIGIRSDSGCVDQMVDLGLLRNGLTQAEKKLIQSDGEFLLNGIAYDPKSNHFYLMGKMWPKIFEVELG